MALTRKQLVDKVNALLVEAQENSGLLLKLGIEIDQLRRVTKEIGTEHAELKAELEQARKDVLVEAKKALMAMAALEFMGLPSLSDENFDAQVTHAAYKLGVFVPKYKYDELKARLLEFVPSEEATRGLD